MKRYVEAISQGLKLNDSEPYSSQVFRKVDYRRRGVIILPIVFLMFFSTSNSAAGIDRNVEADTTEVLDALEAFHGAQARGDSAAVADLLLSDVLISEGGNVESKEHYLSGHFHGDSAYLKAMTRDSISRSVAVRGDTAWIVSRTRLHGNFRDREMDSISVETVVLVRTDGRWLIAAIHWSSGRRG